MISSRQPALSESFSPRSKRPFAEGIETKCVEPPKNLEIIGIWVVVALALARRLCRTLLCSC